MGSMVKTPDGYDVTMFIKSSSDCHLFSAGYNVERADARFGGLRYVYHYYGGGIAVSSARSR